mgnify:CR=1 FL=1
MIKRGDIFFADLDPVIGSEQGGFRPVIVIQNNTGNFFSPTVIAAAVSSARKNDMPTHIKMGSSKLFPKNSVILCEQIRTIDKSRLREYVGSVDAKLMKAVDKALKVSIGVDKSD